MTRDKNDIMKSVRRINPYRKLDFKLTTKEKNLFLKRYKTHPITNIVDDNIEKIFNKLVKKDFIYLDVIYTMWYEYQKHQIKNTIELDYESLSVHPMWINKEKRKDFDDKQTEIY